MWSTIEAPHPSTSASSRRVVLRLASFRYSDLGDVAVGTLAGMFEPSGSEVPMSPTARKRTRSADATGAGGATAVRGWSGAGDPLCGEAAPLMLGGGRAQPPPAERLGTTKKFATSRAVATGPPPPLAASRRRWLPPPGAAVAGAGAAEAFGAASATARETGGPKAECTALQAAGSQAAPAAPPPAPAPQEPASPNW